MIAQSKIKIKSHYLHLLKVIGVLAEINLNSHYAEMPSLNMGNGLTNGMAHVDPNKQILVNMDTIVSFVIQSGQVSVGGTISVSCHDNYVLKDNRKRTLEARL